MLCSNEAVARRFVADGLIVKLGMVVGLRWNQKHFLKISAGKAYQVELLWACEHAFYALWKLALFCGREASDAIAGLSEIVVQLSLERAIQEAETTANQRLGYLTKALKFVIDRVGVPEQSAVDSDVKSRLFRTFASEEDILEDLPTFEGEELPPLPEGVSEAPQVLEGAAPEPPKVRVAITFDNTKRKHGKMIRDALWRHQEFKIGVWTPPTKRYDFNEMADAFKARPIKSKTHNYFARRIPI